MRYKRGHVSKKASLLFWYFWGGKTVMQENNSHFLRWGRTVKNLHCNAQNVKRELNPLDQLGCPSKNYVWQKLYSRQRLKVYFEIANAVWMNGLMIKRKDNIKDFLYGWLGAWGQETKGGWTCGWGHRVSCHSTPPPDQQVVNCTLLSIFVFMSNLGFKPVTLQHWIVGVSEDILEEAAGIYRVAVGEGMPSSPLLTPASDLPAKMLQSSAQ